MQRTPTSPARARESGFTLVEILIACAIGAIVVFTVIELMIRSSGNAEQSSRTLQATRAAQAMTDALNRDLRITQSPDRASTPGWDELRDLFSSPPSSDLDVRDIVLAQPNRLIMRADVTKHDGVECVEYNKIGNVVVRQVTTAGASWRTSCTEAGGTGGMISRKEMVRIGGAAPVPVFSYQVSAGTGGGNCTKTVVASAPSTSIQISSITAVDVDLRAAEQRGRDSRQSYQRTSIPVQSRTGSVYTKALGCSL